MVSPFPVVGRDHTRERADQFETVIHMHESTHKVGNSASQVVLGRMQLAFYATRRTRHGTSRLVRAMWAWLVKTRRAPFRHCNNSGSLALRARLCMK